LVKQGFLVPERRIELGLGKAHRSVISSSRRAITLLQNTRRAAVNACSTHTHAVFRDSRARSIYIPAIYKETVSQSRVDG